MSWDIFWFFRPFEWEEINWKGVSCIPHIIQWEENNKDESTFTGKRLQSLCISYYRLLIAHTLLFLLLFRGGGVMREGIFSCEFLTQTINICLDVVGRGACQLPGTGTDTAMLRCSVHASTQVLACWWGKTPYGLIMFGPQTGLIHVVCQKSGFGFLSVSHSGDAWGCLTDTPG